jgi:catechol 2,3-dioxygenase
MHSAPPTGADTETGTATAAAAAPADRITHGPVHLDVVDAGRSLAFWHDLVGLGETGRDGGVIRLGAGERDLVVLHPGATRRAARGHAGLYHLALHVPDGPEFARVVARLAGARVPQSPTDHVFSMATYLHDPDGLMLEITLETPERFGGFEVGPRGIVMYDEMGRRRAPTEALDLGPLRDWLGDLDVLAPLPAGTTVGHVHLHVPDLGAAVAWYRDVIGFDEHMVMPAIGMADLSAGGRFPHRMALNVWNGPDAVQPPADRARMRRATLVVPDAAALAAVGERIAARGGHAEAGAGGLLTADPAGNPMLVTHAAV